MMGKGPEKYTKEEFERAYQDIFTDLVGPISIGLNKNPSAFLLGGQSGAGKTALHDELKKEYSGNIIVINGDEYRQHHPRFRLLDEKYGKESVAYTAKWAAQMVEALVDGLSGYGFNLIVEGTLRTATAPAKTARLLRERGYSVSLALMAVKPDISLISCQIRYEQMRLAGEITRAVDPKHHETIVRDIVGNLESLEATGLFDEIRLYTRDRQLVFPTDDSTKTASETLYERLFGPWTQEEESHYKFLQDHLANLEKM